MQRRLNGNEGKAGSNATAAIARTLYSALPGDKYVFSTNTHDVRDLSEFATHSHIFPLMKFPTLFYLNV